MNIHYIYAHPGEHSFNHALLQQAQQQLGTRMTVNDLYQNNFKASADWADFKNISQADSPNYGLSQLSASQDKLLTDDIVQELEHIQTADTVILQFPLWWFSAPAILKGWMDRVFVKGQAYGPGQWFDRGGFAGKKAMLVLSTQAPESAFSAQGLNGTMENVLHSLHHSLRFVGFEIIKPIIHYSVATLDDVGRADLIQQYGETLLQLVDRKTLAFPHIDQYDEKLVLCKTTAV